MITPKVYFLFSLLLIVAIATATSVVGQAPSKPLLLGGYTPIQNLSDPHVVDVALFAVKEYNSKQNKARNMLKFVSIVKGWSQVVAGINYRLIISAKRLHGHTAPHSYEAVVYERPWENFMNLTSFKLIDGY